LFPAFLDQLLKDYTVQGGKFHVAGGSNGGLSAFHIASLHPEYFVSVVTFPGHLPEPATQPEIDALRQLCIYMHVGEFDVPWMEVMREQEKIFREKGFKVHFSVEPGQGHGIQTLAGAGVTRLFDEFEAASAGCK
jgi:predicted esterase